VKACCKNSDGAKGGRAAIEELPMELLESMAGALRVLSHGQRLKIVEMLDLVKDAPVHAICDRLNMEQAVASSHLNKMKSAGLLKAERRGKEMWYSIANPHSVTIINCIRSKNAELSKK